METIDRTRLQEDMALSLYKGKNIALFWSTGTGKSRPVVRAFRMEYDSNPDARLLIVVHETNHKKNWAKEFREHDSEEAVDDLLSRVEMVCYASLKKLKGKSYDIIAFDECHHLSDNRLALLKDIRAKRVCLLSATPRKEAMPWLALRYGEFKVNRIGLKRAIESDILPQPEVIVHWMALDKTRKDQEYILDFRKKKDSGPVPDMEVPMNHWRKYAFGRKRYSGRVIRLTGSQRDMMNMLDGLTETYKDLALRNPANIALKNLWLNSGSRRKRWLGEIKTQAAKDILKPIVKKGRRFVCFCASISQAEGLGGKEAVTSKNPKASSIVDAFNEGRRDSLFAVNMLQEGMNLKDIEEGIIIQLDGVERGFIQKSGRMYRAKEPVQHIICVRDTRDEKYLENVLDNIDHGHITNVEIN